MLCISRERALVANRLESGKLEKGRFEAREGWSEAEPFCVTVACRNVLAGRPGQRRCHPAAF